MLRVSARRARRRLLGAVAVVAVVAGVVLVVALGPDKDPAPERFSARPAQQPEALCQLELLRALVQQLHSEAQPQHRHVLRAFAHELVEPALAQPAHRLREGADAGQDDSVGRSKRFVVGCEAHVGADALERLLDRAAVAHPVVHHADRRSRRAFLRRRHAVSVPFVDGTASLSIRTASRNARATPLKEASMMW